MMLECWRLGYARLLRGISAIELVVVVGVSALTYVTLMSHQQREMEQESLEVVAQHMERIANSVIDYRKEHQDTPWPDHISSLTDVGVASINIASRYGGNFSISNASWQQGGGVILVGKFAAANSDARYLDTFYRAGDLLHLVMQRRHGSSRVLYERNPPSEGHGYEVSLLISDDEFSRRPSTAFSSKLILENSPRLGYLSSGPVNISNVLSIGNLPIGAPGPSSSVGNYQQCGFCRVFNAASEADPQEGGDLINTTIDTEDAPFGIWVNSLNHRPGLAPPDFTGPHEVLTSRLVSAGIRFQTPSIGSLGPVSLQLNDTAYLDLTPDAVLSAPLAYLSEPWGITGGVANVIGSNLSRIVNTRNHVRVVAENSIVFNNTALWNTVGLDCNTMTVNWLFYYSDERMKNVTGVLDGKNAIDTVRRTPMYHYDWRDSNSKGIGLLAQDVANVDGVSARARGGVHGVSQAGMIATVWSAVDELADVAADLQKKADILDSEIEQMRAEKRALLQVSTAEMRAQ